MSYQQAGVLGNVPLYIEAKTLAILIMKVILSFPKAYKYTIGNEMQKSAIMVMRNIALAVHASSQEERLRAVAQAYNSHEVEEKRNALEVFQTNLDLVEGLLDISITKQWLKRRNVRNAIYPLIEAA